MPLTLQNFQAWEEAEVHLEGLTVIVGSSNLGKSSFVRALRGVLRNDVSERRIRRGTKSVTVGLNLSGAPALEVKRTKSETTFQVGEETYTKLGGKVPPPVEALNVGAVKVGDYSLDPIFAGQFDGQFLLSAPPAEVTAVLNAFASTDRLDRGRKVLTSRISGLNSQAQALAAFISKGEEDLAAAEELVESAEPAVERARVLSGEVITLQRALEATKKLQALRGEQEATARHLSLIERLEGHLNDVLPRFKVLVRAHRAHTASQALETLHAQHAHTTTVEDLRGSCLTVARKALAATLASRSTVAHQGLVSQVASVEALAALAPHPHAAWTSVKAALALQRALTTATALTDHLKALDTLRDHLNRALIAWKVRVRVVALQTLDVDGPKALASQVGDIGAAVTHQRQIFSTLGIIRGLQDLMSQAAGFEDVGPELQGLEAERSSLEEQLNHVAVTCPKCHHQFNPKESNHGC